MIIQFKSGMTTGTIIALLVETVSLLHERTTDLEARALELEGNAERAELRLQALIDHLNEHTTFGAP